MRRHSGEALPPQKTAWLMRAFWSHVLIDKDGCWEWTGNHQDDGYGILEHRGTPRLAHRISFWLSGHSIDGICVLHRCDNPPCVRPSHLFAGTRQDNMIDKINKGRGWSPHGEASGMAKLTDQDIPQIRYMLTSGWSLAETGRLFGVATSTVRAIASGITWRHVA